MTEISNCPVDVGSGQDVLPEVRRHGRRPTTRTSVGSSGSACADARDAIWVARDREWRNRCRGLDPMNRRSRMNRATEPRCRSPSMTTRPTTPGAGTGVSGAAGWRGQRHAVHPSRGDQASRCVPRGAGPNARGATDPHVRTSAAVDSAQPDMAVTSCAHRQQAAPWRGLNSRSGQDVQPVIFSPHNEACWPAVVIAWRSPTGWDRRRAGPRPGGSGTIRVWGAATTYRIAYRGCPVPCPPCQLSSRSWLTPEHHRPRQRPGWCRTRTALVP